MTYKRFSQLFDALIGDNPGIKKPISMQASPRTIRTLIQYGQGDKKEFDLIKKRLNNENKT